MPRFRPKGSLERSATADVLKHTLANIPTAYGRLAYLASLRDPNSGLYRHHGLAAAFGRDESVRALRLCHENAFVEWLGLMLVEKSDDLREYLRSLEEAPKAVLQYWMQTRIYRSYVPLAARESEKELFSQELELLLNLLLAE